MELTVADTATDLHRIPVFKVFLKLPTPTKVKKYKKARIVFYLNIELEQY